MNLKHSATIIVRNKKILLIKRSEEEDSEPNKWCPPNETLEPKESPENAAVRGVKEEIGLDFLISKKLLEHHYQGHTTFVFLGTATGKIIPNLEEVSDYGWFSYQEAMALEFAYGYNKVIDYLYSSEIIK